MAAAAAKTASTVHAAFFHGTHVLDIDGYSVLKALGRSGGVTSATFRVAGRDWNVVCGFDGGRLANISLALAEKEDADGYVDYHDTVTAMVSFSVEDPCTSTPTGGGGRRKPMKIGSSSSGDDDGEFFLFNHSSRSYMVAVSEAALRKLEARYVVKGGDRLRIRCAVRVSKVADPGPVRYCFVDTPPPTDIAAFLRALLASGRRADVTFAVDGSCRFDAHRVVLAMRSPVFRAKFFGGGRESSSGVGWFRVHDVSAPVFGAMLHFIYTDELPVPADSAAAPAPEDLLVAADLYGLDRLRLMCEKVLWERVRADTDGGVGFGSAIATLSLVNGRDSCRRLQELCIGRVADHWEAATATEEYRALSTAFPTLHGNVLESVIMKQHVPPAMAAMAAKSASVYRPSEVRRGRHELTVLGHSVVRRTRGNGEFVSSGAFEVGGHDWRVLYYPSGFYAGEHRASVILQLLVPPDGNADENGPGPGPGPGVVLEASGTIVVAGNVKDQDEIDFDIDIDYTRAAVFGHRYTKREPAGGYRNLCVSGLVGPDDVLRVECSFEFFQLAPAVATTTEARARLLDQEQDIVVPPPSISWHLARLLEDGVGSDVTFSVDDGGGEFSFHAHTLVLSERAPALLPPSMKKSKDKKKKEKTIRIQGIRAVVFKALLHFVYTDELPPLDDLAQAVGVAEAAGNQQQPPASTTTQLAGDLMAAAERFHLVERLRPLCENLLCELISPENAAATLQLARRHCRAELRTFCLDYMTSPGVFKAVAVSQGYRDLPADALRDIVAQLASALAAAL